MPVANLGLPFSCTRECTQGLLLYVCLYCVNSRWSTWVVRVGAPQGTLSPIPGSQLWAFGPFAFIYHKNLVIGLFFQGEMFTIIYSELYFSKMMKSIFLN